MRERPCYEHDSSLLLSAPINAHGGDLLLADQPRKEQTDVSALLSKSLRTRLQIGAAQCDEF